MNKMIIGIVAALLAAVYVVWPLDFIPDIIPVIGWIDDLVIGAAGIYMLIKGFVN